MNNDELRKKATMYTAQFELSEFYSAVAYSGYNHAIDKLNEVLADFAAEAVRAERIRIAERLDEILGSGFIDNSPSAERSRVNTLIDELREAK